VDGKRHPGYMLENQGTSVATLRKEPMFADAVDFSSLDDASWPASGGCLAHLQEFSGWLCSQSHTNVIVISHKTAIECFLREVSDLKTSVENCVPIHMVVKRSALQAFAARRGAGTSAVTQDGGVARGGGGEAPTQCCRTLSWANLAILDFESNCIPSAHRDPAGWQLWGHNNPENFEPEIVEVPTVIVPRVTEEGVVFTAEEFHAYVRPVHFALTEFCTDFTGITDEMLPTKREDGFGSFAQTWNSWECFMDKLDRPLVVTCGDWDLKTMLPAQMKLSGMKATPVVTRWCNIKICFKKLYQQKTRGMNDMLKFLGIPLDGKHHSGIDDCRNIAKIVVRMFRDGAVAKLAPDDVIFATWPASKVVGNKTARASGRY